MFAAFCAEEPAGVDNDGSADATIGVDAPPGADRARDADDGGMTRGCAAEPVDREAVDAADGAERVGVVEPATRTSRLGDTPGRWPGVFRSRLATLGDFAGFFLSVEAFGVVAAVFSGVSNRSPSDLSLP
ncbi:MAG: hypothetical protein H6818_23710 [Phycisphaerales bacterium]|nr:hypothetical protein [Phycisphaerales bacterium]MCB9864448.1 hypothetical protein [Phycisphaerales bacterium]